MILLTPTTDVATHATYVSPTSFTDDGVFLPGSRYQALHSAFRNHAFLAARQDAESLALNASPSFGIALTSDVLDSEGLIHLSPEQEYRLAKAWVDEVASWVRSRHLASVSCAVADL